MGLAVEEAEIANDETTSSADDQHNYQMGVRSLMEKEIIMKRVPNKYILAETERPNYILENANIMNSNDHLNLPVIDFAQLQGPNRSQVITSLAKACQDYGFFQLVNHGIEADVIDRMNDASKRFFELPSSERSKYMSNDMCSPVRYGTSYNQNNDKVYCWRDFLKLSCHPALSQNFPHHWPSSPVGLREAAVEFSLGTKSVYLMLMEAILESLGLKKEEIITSSSSDDDDEKDVSSKLKLEEGSQLVVMNCYPECPEPELTLGMPPHSDYGLLTLLLQDAQVEGLQIQHQGTWLTVKPLLNSFVVNVGDHLEILSNGRYMSVLHRVVVNSSKSRMSIASLHSVAFNCMIEPSPKLIDKANPKRYKDTDFSSFLHHLASRQHNNNKTFLESRRLL
ncbi:probable 2-oxoglutarate-dependent dioxygenase SLC1 [Humulus lupulus]|uniref:probable 2-oxoglutarate-dependent dioxygenase SLC1 n=1 Tax=Humulus lupulus TaxID=3486 RepID=UPI002B4181FB|nr:probable 2-oxoglutarate-dependent dioxygenase SLC1 [Humulus lupulus]